MEFSGVRFHWLGHDGFKIIAGGKTIYTDPYKLGKAQQKRNDADIVFISHNHFDHLSMDDLKHVISKKTTIVAAKECVDLLKDAGAAEVKGVAPSDRLTLQGVQIEVLAAYNTNKKFHPKADSKVGFVFALSNMRIYHTGDTDDIPEMSAAKPDVALVPVSGTYVMTAEEAAKAVNEKIKPKKLAIPMHYGSIVGSEQDAAKFKELVTTCPVQILNRE
ncbi:MAG: Zn-dependent hydrolase [Thaumarchaeota archaeon 13_1_40CM_2_39_4]|nr:MAG: Zn-dependent hydrolase [Thaumarchaeota archaeon 13_1_40CM_2_39_4]